MAYQFEREVTALTKVYPISKMYSEDGPKFDNHLIDFYLLRDDNGHGINWQELSDRQLMAVPFLKGTEIDWQKLRNIPNLVLSDFLWACNCAEGRFIHHTDVCYCTDCMTAWEGIWDKMNDHGRSTSRKSNQLIPNLFHLWGYERQKFVMTDDQLIALTYGSFKLLEPVGNEYAYS